MIKSIWKYELVGVDRQEIVVPKDSEILCVQYQRGNPCVWVKVNPKEKEKDVLVIWTHGTGHEFDDSNYNYLGTYQMGDGILVFHVFVNGR